MISAFASRHALDALESVIGQILLISVGTGILVRSYQTGRLALRAGLAWGGMFAIGMLILALPGFAAALATSIWGWPNALDEWRHNDPRNFAEIASGSSLVFGGLLALRAIPVLANIEKKLRGDI